MEGLGERVQNTAALVHREMDHMIASFLAGMLVRDGFFFQAEDGIRDLTVTGVQTCALPIYADAQWDSVLLTGSVLVEALIQLTTQNPIEHQRLLETFPIELAVEPNELNIILG